MGLHNSKGLGKEKHNDIKSTIVTCSKIGSQRTYEVNNEYLTFSSYDCKTNQYSKSKISNTQIIRHRLQPLTAYEYVKKTQKTELNVFLKFM